MDMQGPGAAPAHADVAKAQEAVVRLENVAMGYGAHVLPHAYILADINLAIGADEFFVPVGPSGSGKSTLLKLIAGTAFANEGKVWFEGAPVKGPGRARALVFQSVEAPLLDWLTVAQNIGFGLKIAGMAHEQRKEIIATHQPYRLSLRIVALMRGAGNPPAGQAGSRSDRPRRTPATLCAAPLPAADHSPSISWSGSLSLKRNRLSERDLPQA